MRRIAVPTSVVVTTALSAAALAATTTITSNGDFNNSSVETNVQITANEIRLDNIVNLVDEWYRAPYDGMNYGIELQKDDAGGGIWTDDTCLDDADNTFPADVEIIGSTAFRMGPFAGGTLAKTIAPTVPIDVLNGNEISTIEFLTHGARGPLGTEDAIYTVTVDLQGGDQVVFDVDILSASTAVRSGSGSGVLNGATAFGSWSTASYTGFTNNGGAECAGDAGDHVTLTLPPGSIVETITFDYGEEDGTNPWLGGPFALSTDGIQADIEDDFLFRGSYESAFQVADAVSGGGNTIWYEVEWDATIAGNNDVFLRVRCGSNDQTTGNTTITNNEWKDRDGGSTGPGVWQDPIDLRTTTSPFRIEDCTGTHLMYELEFHAEFEALNRPTVQELRFIHNPDRDEDGYPAETVVGHPTEDCDDTDEALNWEDRDGDGFDTCQAANTDCNDDPLDPEAQFINVNATPVAADVGDGLDRDCDGREECFFDEDNDTYGVASDIRPENGTPDLVCNVGMETGRNDGDFDCADTVFAINPGHVVVAADVGDEIDADCNGFEECFENLDGDDFGTDTIIDESTDGDNTCERLNGEAVVNGDCMDVGPEADTVYPGKTITADDIDDDLDNNCSETDGVGDECWLDADNDGFGNDQGNFIDSDNLNCTNANESVNALDCRDTGTDAFDIKPGITITNAQIDNGIDDNCTESDGVGDECWADVDADGFGNDDGIHVESTNASCADAGEAIGANNDEDCLDTGPDGPDVRPGKPLVAGDVDNNLDNDCSNNGAGDECWLDDDRDGFGNDEGDIIQSADQDCDDQEEAGLGNDNDCDDNDTDFNPGIDETCPGPFAGDGIDNNCDGIADDDDLDGLSFSQETAFGTDDCLIDSDLDGLDDLLEFNHDCGPMATLSLEGDNPDTDGDGVPDGAEGLDDDTDGDGIKNPCDADDDGDGIPTSVEITFGNTDAAYDVSDTIPDYLDDDDDNDGLLTSAETGDFPDASGLPDYRNEDDDGDGLLTAYELSFPGLENRDGTGELNHRDLDSDGDGFDDIDESGTNATNPNFDGDSLPDFLDFDSDNDSIPDASEFDGDSGGSPRDDRNDTDDDGDGLSTSYENSFGLPDRDGDTLPNWRDLDSDGDGFSDAEEESVGGPNFDGTDQPDFLDFDSDNDGVLDEYEFDGDTDGTQLDDRVDTDDDGDSIPTSVEIGSTTGPNYANFDGADLPDHRDTDDDNDGLLTIDEQPRPGEPSDPDGDGPNHKDLDSDGDGWSDNVEQRGTAPTPDPNFDHDGDGIRDFLDLDSDNDSIPDVSEFNGNSGGSPRDDRNDDDDDGDGLPTAYENSFGLPDRDGDTLPNWRDLDSDGDGFSDAEEESVGGPNFDGTDQPDFLDFDSDNDGVLDEYEFDGDTDGTQLDDRVDTDDDGDSIPTSVEIGSTTGPNYANFDGADLPDHRDTDDDNDGLLTIDEQPRPGEPSDLDGDGPNHKDLDSDGDGWSDTIEQRGPGASPDEDFDHDGDGVRDFLDLDSDDDSVPDASELDEDTDGTQSFNRNDNDDDGDGIPTFREHPTSAAETASGSLPSPIWSGNRDGSGGPNYLDTDSDGDGISDTIEWNQTANGSSGRDSDGDGARDFLDLDSDNDSLSDAAENTNDADGDGDRDRVDDDDDGDGVPTIVELPRGDSFTTGNGHTDDDCGGTTPCPDYLDNDDDDDGILTSVERVFGNTDAGYANPDSAVDYLDRDDDGDGILTKDEPLTCGGSANTSINRDGDAFDDYRDEDDDGDGLLTAYELSFPNDPDNDDDCNHRDLDSDGDTFPDAHENSEAGPNANFDGTGRPDFLDTDSDDDGVLDIDEGPVGRDTDGTEGEDRIDVDDDGDGRLTADELAFGNTDGSYAVSDTIPDYLDEDDDNDGLLTRDETGDFPDPSGLPDYRNEDDDGDGLLTAFELSFGGRENRDGVGELNHRDLDSDGDGFLDIDESGSNAPSIGYNFDGDGLPDFLDFDSDNDSVLDEFEFDGNTDSAGRDDRNDTDDDGDGLDTSYENSFGLPDRDGDGLQNWRDLDSDADGFSDQHEDSVGGQNFDGTDQPDFLDFDSDNDGVRDEYETAGDTDGTQLEDRVDIDDDGDSVLTSTEIGTATGPTFPDFDNDSIDDHLDNDDDDDGILTRFELPRGLELLDRDGDGPNYKDVDSDGDGISDRIEQSGQGTSPDPDFDWDDDGLRDFLDLDSDQDEVPDEFERNANTDGQGSFDRNDDDDDGDGILTRLEFAQNLLETAETPLATLPNPIWESNFDNDLNPNYLDTDSDGDTVPDAVERAVDSDDDTIRDFLDLDSDNDTVADASELDEDTDNDGDDNRVDDDDDGDTVPTAIEFPRGDSFTTTADGHVDDDCGGDLPCVDYLDPDDDDDGYATSVEFAFGNTDQNYANPDSAPDYLDRDDDGDGLLSLVEPVTCGSLATTRGNFDNDAFDDYRDEDDDNDGLLTAYELSFGVNDQDGDDDCNHRDLDADGDGFGDGHEDSVGGQNFDNTDLPDFLDTDSDNDGVPDAEEGPEGRDTDGRSNDLENRVDIDDDGDGILTATELAWTDGTLDHLDNDDDGDNVPTLLELCFDAGGNCPTLFTGAADAPLTAAQLAGAQDFDGDGTLDLLDTDDDDDSLPTADEIGCSDPAGTAPLLVDIDADGNPNFLDTDDDDDTIPTLLEQLGGDCDDTPGGLSADADGDACPNAYETDSDGDGWPDRHEWNTTQALAGTFDFDEDGLCDFVDVDSDDDGVPDATELDPLMGDPLYPGGVWDPTLQDWTVDPPDGDGDGFEDRLDDDDDDDGIPTYLETFACSFGDDGSVLLATTVFDDMRLADATGGDCVEGTTEDASEYDWDGDGLWNYLDTDDDNDNVPTLLEDYDYDAELPFVDHDSDAGQFTDVVLAIDPGPQPEIDDSDDPLDIDPDPDMVLGQNDTDNDGSPDFLDVDDDGDGVATILEDWDSPGSPWDTNTNVQASQDALVDPFMLGAGDNLPDFLDPDDDGDGRLTVLEDLDGDGDPRNDNTNAEPSVLTPSLREACPEDLRELAIGCFDTTPDYLDVDDEGDGVPTWAEDALAITFGQGSDPYASDTDGDLILDGEEWINFLRIQTPGVSDPLTVTIDEFAGIDVDPVACATLIDGTPRNADVNGDGIPDPREGRTWAKPWDRDCDGTPNVFDLDDDNDGFDTNQAGDNRDDIDCAPNIAIAVGDGIPNYLDIDSDNQSIIVSSSIGDSRCTPGSADTDTNGDGVLDSCTLTTDREEFDSTGVSGDFDLDDIIDPFDCIETGPTGDDDGDRIQNFVEDALCEANIQFRNAQPLWPFDDCGDSVTLTRDSCRASPDSDCDGVLDCEELSTEDLNLCDGPLLTDIDPATFQLRDTDGDAIPDIFDRDDDNDGIPTVDELAFDCTTGGVGPANIGVDVTSTGLPWRWYCVDLEGNRTGFELGTTAADRPSSLNTDGSFAAPFPLQPDNHPLFGALPDFIDPDDDGDGRLTVVEGSGDLDGDDIVNYLDPYDFDGPLADPDQDGITTEAENAEGTSPYSDDTDGDGIPDNVERGLDTDGDGTPDALDPDDDNDTIPSRIEGIGDQDGDGIPNYRDEDSDGDGVSDFDEIGNDGPLTDSDCDGLADFLDARDDSSVYCESGETGVTPPGGDGCEGCSSSSGPSGLFGVLGVFALGLMRRRR